MKPITILLTGCGAPGAPSIIHCFRLVSERAIKIVGVDASAEASCRALVDSFYQIPLASSDVFIQEVEKICEIENVDVVVPIVTRELSRFAQAKNQFESRGIRVSVMDEDHLLIANDKGALLSAIAKAGLPVAAFEIAEKADDIIPACEKLGFPKKPVVIKMTSGNGSRGVRIIDSSVSPYDLFFDQKPDSLFMSLNDLKSIVSEGDKVPALLVMEYLPGAEWSVDILADNGKVIYNACRRGLKISCGNLMACVTESNPQAMKICADVVETLGLDGSIGFDMKTRDDGNIVIMEINPRLTGSIALNAVAGLNLPYLRVKQLLGEPLGEQEFKDGITMQRMHQELYYGPDGTLITW